MQNIYLFHTLQVDPLPEQQCFFIQGYRSLPLDVEDSRLVGFCNKETDCLIAVLVATRDLAILAKVRKERGLTSFAFDHSMAIFPID